MGVAARLSKKLHDEIQAHLAWLPVANNFALGDYGHISHGVFVRLGSIADHGVPVSGREAPPVELNFKSEDARMVSLVGGAVVDALPPTAIEAKLKIEFSGSDSYLVRAASTSVMEISNLGELATQLAKVKGWRRGYRVVWSTITGHDCIVVTSKAANASFELSGNADALAGVGVGAVDAKAFATTEHGVGLSIVGDTGVVGLRLFKLKLWGNQARLLGPGDEAEPELEDDAELEDDV